LQLAFDPENLRERTYRTMATPTEKSIVAELMALVDGLEKNLPNKSFVSASQSYTGPEVIAEVRAIHAAASAVVEARGTLTDALRAHAKMRHDKAEFLRHLRDTLRTAYSNDQVTLAEFGLAPTRSRGAPTGEELLVRVTKSQATRKERRTMGKRQRAAIKGDVTGVVITPTVKEEEESEG
jgi:hypothetical protein